jgi:transposase, IS30 family
MRYHQITPVERYTLSALLRQVPALSCAAIARMMGRHRSTMWRELERNSARYDGAYRPSKAQERTNGRRSRSRRNSHFTGSNWKLIESRLREHLSPEQVSGRLRREGLLEISHETIYKHVWRDKRDGGTLFRSLRQPTKKRKRYGTYEKRGHLPGKRHISERSPLVELRREFGHWEIDTVHGKLGTDCVVTLVERACGFSLIGKLPDYTMAALNDRVLKFMRSHPEWFKTITADNGSEFHSYRVLEDASGATIYFATPYHSWERGTNENTNGLIRQYLPKGQSMEGLTQAQCNAIALKLNSRPRKRYDYMTPIERMAELTNCPATR